MFAIHYSCLPFYSYQVPITFLPCSYHVRIMFVFPVSHFRGIRHVIEANKIWTKCVESTGLTAVCWFVEWALVKCILIPVSPVFTLLRHRKTDR